MNRLWLQLRSWIGKRDSTPDPRPVEDWSDYPAVRNKHGSNPRVQQDNDDRRRTP